MQEQTHIPPHDGGFIIDKPVFFSSIAIVLALVLAATSLPEATGAVFGHIQAAITQYASWYYVLVVAIILVAVLFFGFSRSF